MPQPVSARKRQVNRWSGGHGTLLEQREFSVIQPEKHQKSAAIAARTNARPDCYRGEKLGLAVSALYLMAIGGLYLAADGADGTADRAEQWRRQAVSLPLPESVPLPASLPLPVRKPSPQLRSQLQPPGLYPPARRAAAASPYGLVEPQLPRRRSRRARKRPQVKWLWRGPAYPVTVQLPEQVLPPLPPFKRITRYPHMLRMPATPPLALITPPPPRRPSWYRQRRGKAGYLAGPAVLAGLAGLADLAVTTYPPRLTLPQQLLPPLPPFARAASYPTAIRIPAAPQPAPIKPPPPGHQQKTASVPSASPPAFLPGGLTVARHALAQQPKPNHRRRNPWALDTLNTKAAIRNEQPGRAGHGKDAGKVMANTLRTEAALAKDDIGLGGQATPDPSALSDPLAFGLKVVAAAKAQMGDLTIYDARYVQLPYPMGDLPSVYGVCSDVIVRAYRRLGFDLQELVYRARVGSGDANIDHRRTAVLRRFFERHARSLPITDYPEDYLPGDIVSYHRPFGRSSKSHIAIVSDEIAPSGNPYLLHNRAWGVQREDALFADRITGHYRFNQVLPPKNNRLIAAVMAQKAIPLPPRKPPRRAARRKPFHLVSWKSEDYRRTIEPMGPTRSTRSTRLTGSTRPIGSVDLFVRTPQGQRATKLAQAATTTRPPKRRHRQRRHSLCSQRPMAANQERFSERFKPTCHRKAGRKVARSGRNFKPLKARAMSLGGPRRKR